MFLLNKPVPQQIKWSKVLNVVPSLFAIWELTALLGVGTVLLSFWRHFWWDFRSTVGDAVWLFDCGLFFDINKNQKAPGSVSKRLHTKPDHPFLPEEQGEGDVLSPCLFLFRRVASVYERVSTTKTRGVPTGLSAVLQHRAALEASVLSFTTF